MLHSFIAKKNSKSNLEKSKLGMMEGREYMPVIWHPGGRQAELWVQDQPTPHRLSSRATKWDSVFKKKKGKKAKQWEKYKYKTQEVHINISNHLEAQLLQDWTYALQLD